MLQPGVIRKKLMLMSALNGCKTLSREGESEEFRDFRSLVRNQNVYSNSQSWSLVVGLGLWSEVNNLADDNLNGLRQSVS